MINKNNLPPSWAIAKLGEVCENISLNGIKIKQKQYLIHGKFPVIDQGQELIGGYFNDEKFVVPSDPPFIIFGDHTKIKKFVGFKFIAGADGIKVLKPIACFDPKLFYYFIHWIKIPDRGYSRHFQFLVESEIPIPPLHEQHRIVKKIEELFTDLDKGIEYLESTQQQLKIYRQAVLKWAFEGKLTNKNLVDGELPKGWKWIKLGDVVNNLDGKRIPLSRTVRATRKGKYRYYGATEVVDYIDDFLFDGDYLLVGEDGANLLSKSKPLAFIVEGKFWVNNHAHVLQAKEITNNKFICQYFNSLNLSQFVTGTAQPKLTQANMNKIKIPISSSSEQHRIVSEIESRLSVCDKIEEAIEDSLLKAEALRLSIIKKGFEGKLVKQNPKDESAEILLEKIRAEIKKNNPDKPKKQVTIKTRKKK